MSKSHIKTFFEWQTPHLWVMMDGAIIIYRYCILCKWHPIPFQMALNCVIITYFEVTSQYRHKYEKIKSFRNSPRCYNEILEYLDYFCFGYHQDHQVSLHQSKHDNNGHHRLLWLCMVFNYHFQDLPIIQVMNSLKIVLLFVACVYLESQHVASCSQGKCETIINKLCRIDSTCSQLFTR